MTIQVLLQADEAAAFVFVPLFNLHLTYARAAAGKYVSGRRLVLVARSAFRSRELRVGRLLAPALAGELRATDPHRLARRGPVRARKAENQKKN